MSRQGKIFGFSVSEVKKSICQLCMGHRFLCGRSFCPILLKARLSLSIKKLLDALEIQGSSPPSTFVGSWGYPKVTIGPLTPPIKGRETCLMDSPEKWIHMAMDEILRYRFMLVRGKIRVGVEEARNPGRLVLSVQEIAMSTNPVDLEVDFKRKPSLKPVFSPREAPMGFSAPIKRLFLEGNPKIQRKIDYVTSDVDLKANEAVINLYRAGFPQRQIMRIFSLGLIGLKSKRRIVPTEWSITAVDDIIGKTLHREILGYPEINHYLVFGCKALGNNVQILMMPSTWMFEVLEAWILTTKPKIYTDYEYTRGRKNYAENTAGAYYAVRLPVLEYLSMERRQAAVIAFLEVYREWVPLGVWRFREIAREALKKKPLRFETIKEAIRELNKKLKISPYFWLRKSEIYRSFTSQTKLTSFV